MRMPVGQISLDESLIDDRRAVAAFPAGEDANAEGREKTGTEVIEVDYAGCDAALGLDGDGIVPAPAGQECPARLAGDASGG
jgi:hypothetical protein